ncbi:hypothetical protein [Halorhabdus amylolytica]|uniref:hypothetical protein n=1 Tax=Halorhabdus amylolytica TaxID=2559573 RepID=UPI0010AA01F1|nr:hypothetical protein [Halorhabdus amylolytica]
MTYGPLVEVPDSPVQVVASIHYADDQPDDAVETLREMLEVMAGWIVCDWCLTRIRNVHPAYDRAKARRLSIGDTRYALEASSYRVTSEGTVEASLETSIPTPDTYVGYGPGDTSKSTACPSCGRMDGEHPGKNRTKREREDHFKNLAAAIEERADFSLDTEAGIDEVYAASKNCNLDDFDVLARALYAAI